MNGVNDRTTSRAWLHLGGDGLCARALEGAAFALDLGRVMVWLPGIDRARKREGPGPLLSKVRTWGLRHAPRSPTSRARLARAIGWVDRLGPGGPNCYRRTLLRIALDPSAASEPVTFGLDVPERKGHAWVSGNEAPDRFDVEFRIEK